MPPTGDTFVLLRILPHDKAIAWAMKQESSINAVTRAVEIRDAATLDEITPAYERMAESSPKPRLFAKFSDGDLSALGIDPETLRQARSLVDQEQLDVFAPLLPQDQREVLQYLAAGCTVEEVWRDIVAPALQESTQPVDKTAIRHTRARIALVTATERQAARGQARRSRHAVQVVPRCRRPWRHLPRPPRTRHAGHRLEAAGRRPAGR